MKGTGARTITDNSFRLEGNVLLDTWLRQFNMRERHRSEACSHKEGEYQVRRFHCSTGLLSSENAMHQIVGERREKRRQCVRLFCAGHSLLPLTTIQPIFSCMWQCPARVQHRNGFDVDQHCANLDREARFRAVDPTSVILG